MRLSMCVGICIARRSMHLGPLPPGAEMEVTGSAGLHSTLLECCIATYGGDTLYRLRTIVDITALADGVENMSLVYSNPQTIKSRTRVESQRMGCLISPLPFFKSICKGRPAWRGAELLVHNMPLE